MIKLNLTKIQASPFLWKTPFLKKHKGEGGGRKEIKLTPNPLFEFFLLNLHYLGLKHGFIKYNIRLFTDSYKYYKAQADE